MMTDMNAPAPQAGSQAAGSQAAGPQAARPQAARPQAAGPQPDAGALAAGPSAISPVPACLPCLPVGGGSGGRRRALWGWSPPDQAADTAMKRRADRLLPRSGVSALVCFAVVAGLFSLAPHLPVRADLAADGLAVLASGAWCGLNFWRCRHAHCLVTGAGWLALAVVAFAGTAVGHSLISGYEQPVFLVVLGIALVFEVAWRCARGTNAVGRLAAPPRS